MTTHRKLPATIAALAFASMLTGCMTQTRSVDLSQDKRSANGSYHVTVVPPEQAPAINQIHSWRVRLQGPAGEPVTGARFVVDGGMPQHGHGLPTQPRITRELESGTYRLDGMKFSMTGWWEVKLGIQGPLGSDTVTFNVMVKNPPVNL